MCEAVLRCVHQDAKRAQHRDAKSLGLLAGISIIDQQRFADSSAARAIASLSPAPRTVRREVRVCIGA
jgi:hypothetical protein